MTRLVQCKSVPCRLPEKTARRIDDIVKALPSGCDYRRKAMDAQYQFSPGERAEVSILSTATVDKSNEVVQPSKLDLTTYNRTVLWNHDSDIVVGECPWLKYQPKPDNLIGKTVYFENTEDVPSNWYKFVNECWWMVKAGAIKAKSIGFQPLTPLRDPTPEELTLHPEWKGAGIWDEAMLLEYSVCTVGLNNESLVVAVNEKGIRAEVLTALGLPDFVGTNPLQEAIECAIRAKKYTPPVRKKKKPDPAVMLAAVLAHLDVNRIAHSAQQAYRNRGRV